jgi:hypothetical protein
MVPLWNEMAEKLSSCWTFIYKIVFPVIWISAFGIGTLMLWLGEFDQPQSPSMEVKWGFLFTWLAGSSLILWLALHLKTVALKGDTLLIKNYSREDTVTLSSINRISETRFINPKTIKLNLYSPCVFGEKVVFIPKFKFYNPFDQHPIVKLLKELTHQ